MTVAPAAATASVPAGSGSANSCAGPCRNARGAAVAPARPGRGRGFGAGGEDALDGAVGRVPGRDRLRAGGLEPGRVVLVGQADDALGGAEPVTARCRRAARRSPARRPGRRPRPGGGTRPGSACGTRSSPAGSRPRSVCFPRSLRGWVLTSCPLVEELHHRRRWTRTSSGLADVPPRHRVEHPADLGVDVRADLRRRPAWPARTAPAGSGCSASRLDRVEHRGRGARPPAAGTPARPATSAHQRAAAACICASEVNSRPRQNESRTYGIGRSTCGLSLGLSALAGSIRQP